MIIDTKKVTFLMALVFSTPHLTTAQVQTPSQPTSSKTLSSTTQKTKNILSEKLKKYPKAQQVLEKAKQPIAIVSAFILLLLVTYLSWPRKKINKINAETTQQTENQKKVTTQDLPKKAEPQQPSTQSDFGGSVIITKRASGHLDQVVQSIQNASSNSDTDSLPAAFLNRNNKMLQRGKERAEKKTDDRLKELDLQYQQEKNSENPDENKLAYLDLQMNDIAVQGIRNREGKINLKPGKGKNRSRVANLFGGTPAPATSPSPTTSDSEINSDEEIFSSPRGLAPELLDGALEVLNAPSESTNS